MKILSGVLGGRLFDAPKGHRTQPMSERVRGALFNMLGDVTGLDVLDAYAGSGALGLEALSRGAKFAQFVEIDKAAYEVIQRNITQLKLSEKAKATSADIEFWSKRNPKKSFDLVFADPPYDAIDLSTLSRLASHIKPNGLMVVSYPGRGSAPTVNGVVVVDNRSYGDAALVFYRRNQNTG